MNTHLSPGILARGMLATSLLCAPSFAHSSGEQPNAEQVRLEARWAPTVRSMNMMHEREDLKDLLQPGVAAREADYQWKAFEALLPDADQQLGSTWKMDAEKLFPFLKQIHPEPRAKLHMGGGRMEGAYGILLERSADRIDMLCRIHIEFELQADAYLTISQFEGRLIANPQTGEVESFRLSVPPRENNFDLHIKAAKQPDQTPVTRNGVQFVPGISYDLDMGFIPEMGVFSKDYLIEEPDDVSMAVARKQLRLAYYAFEQIDWMPLNEAMAEATELNMPVHAIVILGPLDDESC